MSLQATLLIVLSGTCVTIGSAQPAAPDTSAFAPESREELKGAFDKCLVGSFTFVKIPHGKGELEEIIKSKQGGLHKDELHKYVKEYYATSDDEKVRKEMSNRKLPENKPIYTETILDVPRPQNGFVATVLYGERHGLHVNERATSIARACGWLSKLLYGDAFVTRAFDRDEDEWPWDRRDFFIKDFNEDLEWVGEAKRNNFNLVSGMEKRDHRQDQSTEEKQGPVTWRQTQEELEVSIDLPDGVKARDISLTMKYNLIKFGLKNGHAMPEENSKGSATLLKLLLSGMKLFASIDTDLSTWTVSEGQLVMSLTKKDPMEWDILFRLTI